MVRYVTRRRVCATTVVVKARRDAAGFLVIHGGGPCYSCRVITYLLALYDNEKNDDGKSEAEMAELLGEYEAFTESIKQSGHYLGGEALHPTSSASTVRVRAGKVLSTDGPFAETREQLGGFYLIKAKDREEALAIAARLPAAKTGSVEVRPCIDFSQQG